MGVNSARYNQGSRSIAIGYSAGNTGQGGVTGNAIAIGSSAGNSNQQANSIAIGISAGNSNQQANSIAIGSSAGNYNQQVNSIAIGSSAGRTGQGGTTGNAIAIGSFAGNSNQQTNSIAIGNLAGSSNQQANSIAIGYGAGQEIQYSNSIIINASSDSLNGGTTGALYINPIRPDATNTSNALYYNIFSKEITYNSVAKPQALQYKLSGNTGLQGATGYTIIFDSYTDAYNGFTGYNPTTGVFTNTETNTISVQMDVQISAEQGNWDVRFLKNGSPEWISQILGTYNINSFSHNLLLANGETAAMYLNISGPTGYTLNANDTKIQIVKIS